MIELLKDDDLIQKVGGRFRLTALIQARWRQLMHGARPMVEAEGLSELEIILKEIVEGKIEAVQQEGPDDAEDDDQE